MKTTLFILALALASSVVFGQQVDVHVFRQWHDNATGQNKAKLQAACNTVINYAEHRSVSLSECQSAQEVLTDFKGTLAKRGDTIGVQHIDAAIAFLGENNIGSSLPIAPKENARNPGISTMEVNVIMASCPKEYNDGPCRILWRIANCDTKKSQASREALSDAIAVLTGNEPERPLNSAEQCGRMLVKAKLKVAENRGGEFQEWAEEDVDVLAKAKAALEECNAQRAQNKSTSIVPRPKMQSSDGKYDPFAPPAKQLEEKQQTAQAKRFTRPPGQ